MHAIKIENLNKVYQKADIVKNALSDVNLTIPEGSFYGLLGSNGAGKSTLINILAGIVTKTSGKVFLCNYDLDFENVKARYNLGIVPQELILDPFFTVKETIENYCRYYAVPNVKNKTNQIIEALGLIDKANVHPRKLSGGMQRRLLIAKALVHEPKILILDEPTAGVDIELRKQLWDYVKKLNKLGTTIILTTHYLEEAQELCDYIAILNEGRIIADSQKSELMNILDHKQINIKFTENITFVPKNLEYLNCILNNDNSLTIRYKSHQINFDEILQHIRENNLIIKDISTEESNLEDIFSYLISKS